MQPYRNESSDPKINAQRNLCGRTHYVDDDTLRWHKSRVLSARHTDQGLLFAITTSDAADMNNTRRVYRYVIFDVFGTVLKRPPLDEAFRTHHQALKAMWQELGYIDAWSHTAAAIVEAKAAYAKEIDEFAVLIEALAKGSGMMPPTEQEAIADLMEQLEDDADYAAWCEAEQRRDDAREGFDE